MSSFPLPNFDTDLTGQVAFVTGATSGLGARFARVLAGAGASVAITGRRVDRLTSLAAEIADGGGRVLPLRLDVTDAEQIVAAVDAAQRQLGLVTILVNNAGVPDAQYATRMPLAVVDLVLATNLRAPYLLAREVAGRLIEAGVPGRIVNISSLASFSAAPASTLYATAKAAVNRMTEVLAAEWARFYINVNAIAPGSFSTEMMEGMIARVGDPTGSFPRNRLGDPAQLDGALLYLVAPASDFVTGAVIRVDDAQALH